LNWDGIDSKRIEKVSGKYEKMRTLQKPWCRWGDDIRADLKEIERKPE
jgi:hypothetical protein